MGKKGETLTAKKPAPVGPVYPKGSMFLLEGAGDAGWNGFYNMGGTQSALKAYAHSKSKEKRLYCDASGRWVCVEGGEFFYFAPGGKGPRPPTGGWSVQRGAAPAPQLSWNPDAKARLEEEEQETKAIAVAARKREREARAAAKKTGGGKVEETQQQQITRLQKQLMPLVKRGESLEAGGKDLEGALALYKKAMDGFAAEGVSRPKLKQKMDSVMEQITTCGDAAGGDGSARGTSALDHSVEIDASVEAD
jgi:ribosomal protein L22